jgi:nucleotide-binding universal stress UspA family protein
MFERIMAPLDGSSTAEIALPYAEEIADKLGSEIILTSVSEHVGAMQKKSPPYSRRYEDNRCDFE